MKKVLSRSVQCSDGVTYPEGTPIEDCPAENRDSIVGSGWTKDAESQPQSPRLDPPQSPRLDPPQEQSDESADPDVASTESAEPESEPSQDAGEPGTDASSDSEPSGASREASGEKDRSAGVQTLEISNDLAEKLINGGIKTVDQAKAHLDQHESFRTIKGIGKASDEQIKQAIS